MDFQIDEERSESIIIKLTTRKRKKLLQKYDKKVYDTVCGIRNLRKKRKLLGGISLGYKVDQFEQFEELDFFRCYGR